MTKLLQDAFTVVSANFSRKEQERFAHLILENIGRLREFLEEESEERNFDRIAVETVKSLKIQNLLGRAAEKYKNRKSSEGHLAEAIYALQVSCGPRVPVFFSSDSDNPIQIDLTPIEYDKPSQSIQAVLPDGNILTMVNSKVEVREENNYSWIGNIEGIDIGDTVMTVAGGVMFGRINADGESYSIYPAGDNYKVMKNDSASIAPHGNDALVPDAFLKKPF